MDLETPNSLFKPVLSRFRDTIETDQMAALFGIVKRLQYEPEFLAGAALNTICTCLSNACFNKIPVSLDDFGIFTANDKTFSFLPHDKLLFQIKCYDTLSSPSWISSLGMNEVLDRDLLIKILAVELRDMSAEECSTIAVVAFNGIIRAMTWFLAKCKVVHIDGIGRFEVVSAKEVKYDPDPLIKETIGLKERVRKLRESEPKIELLGTSLMGSSAADVFSDGDIAEIVQACEEGGLTEEEVGAVKAELEKIKK